MSEADPVVAEYEVFKNDKNALAFFMSRHSGLDQNPPDGPFWFNIEDGCIHAGTSEFYATFEDVQPEILNIAKQRGVIMMIEFENQQPVRCTPCYFSEEF